MMTIRLNNTDHVLAADENHLIKLLKTKNLYRDRGIAVAINNEILPKKDWENYLLKDNDNILIITATQGG